MSLRSFKLVLRLVLLLPAIVAAGPAAAAQAFSFDDIDARAAALAKAPYKAPAASLPKALSDLTPEQYGQIRFRPDRAHWHADKLPFELQFFHLGRYYDQPVRINEIKGGAVHEIRFDPADFDYGDLKIDPNALKGLGFAGLRVLSSINDPKSKDEMLVFLGASYFRSVAKGQRYGLSARGLAVDTGLISGEEFPRFTEFWIVRPAPHAKELTLYALLESRRVTGAYSFVVRPGTETVMETRARIYLRENVSKLGVAPLTSMYFFGENQPSGRADYRPEVHDSDGLSIASGTGEWIWRPLLNPKRLLVTSFAMSNPQGFGLMQRDRNFDDYQELDEGYGQRPSAWIEPEGNWGAGRVELVQIPTPDETNDNVVAYWAPDQAKPGVPMDYRYRIHWQGADDRKPPLSWVTQTRFGKAMTANAPADNAIGFVIDFAGPALAKLPADAPVEGIVTIDSNGELLARKTVHNDVTGGWRVFLRLRRVDPDKPVEMRAYLSGHDATLSETWSYILPPG